MSKWNAIVVSLCSGNLKNINGDDVKVLRTIGNHDILAISPINGDTATNVLKKMWKKTKSFSENAKPGTSIHNLFGVAKSDNCDLFWETDSKYLFVSEIQLNFKHGSINEAKLNEFEAELSSMLNELKLEENKDFVVYYSLDCGDVILFLKTDEYIKGADVIHEITIKSDFKHYGYSVCGINMDLALSDASYCEVVPKVVIGLVFSDAAEYKKWYTCFEKEYPNKLFPHNAMQQINTLDKSEMYEEIVHLARLGNEDICINIYNCNLSHFVKMLQGNGIFSCDNDCVNKTFSKLRIQIDTAIDDISPKHPRDNLDGISLIQKLNSKWEKVLQSSHINSFVYKALIEVLNAIENLELKEFAIDVQDCVRNVFPLFVKKIENFNGVGTSFNSSSFEKQYFTNDFNKDLILFTTGLMSIANGSLHADKLFVNVPGFNAVLCDVPAKLLIYYTSYIQHMVDVLNDSNSLEYRFLLCPDLYLNVEVKSLFQYKNDDSLLLKVRLPVKKIFDPQTLLMELSHEAAHFVETDVRSRKERVEFLADIVAIILSDKLLKPIVILSENPSFNNLEFEILKQFLPENTTVEEVVNDEWKVICSFFKEWLLKNTGNENEDLYLSNIKFTFMESLCQLFGGEFSSNNDKQIMLDTVYDVVTKHESINVEYQYFIYLTSILKRHVEQVLLPEYRKIVSRTCTLLSESFADLVMLYITNNPVAYLKNIFNIEKTKVVQAFGKKCYPWDEKFICEMSFERIISVLSTLGFDLDKDIPQDQLNEDSDFKNFVQAIKDYNNKNDYNNRAFPYAVIEKTKDYLNICLEKLKAKESKMKKLKELYNSITIPNSVYKCIKLYRECAFQFRENIAKEIDSLEETE